MSQSDQVSQDGATASALDSPASGDQIALSAIPEYESFHPSWNSNQTQTCWAITNLKAPFYEPESRSPVDIVAVIDKSGSMRGQKIELVKKTLLFVVDQLKDNDRISLVTYDTQVELVFGLMKMEKQNKQRVKTIIESIHDGSSTNLCGGLLKGMEQIALTCGGEKAQVQSVLLLTDGLANHWITSKDGIIAEMKKMQDEGLGAVSTPSSQPVHHAPPFMQQQRRQQRQQRRVPPAFRPHPPPGPPPIQQQAPPLPPPQVMQQQAPPPPSPQVMQQQAPPPPPQVMQQQAPPPPPLLMPLLQQAQQLPPEKEPTKLDAVSRGYKFDGTVYTFGFGSDHDATMLEAISTQGGGVYYYIDSNEKIPESFADCLGGLLSVVGQNLSLTLETVGQYSFKNVHANRAIKWTTPNKSCEIVLGDLQSEEERDIVLEVLVPPVPLGTNLPVLNEPMFCAQLSYFNVITSQMNRVECQLTVTRDYNEEQKRSDEKISGNRPPPNMAVDIQRNRILATSVLKEAESLADQGKLSEAQKALKDVMHRLQQSVSGDQDFCKLLLSDLKRCLEGMTNRHSYQGHGKLAMVNMIQSHSVQRSNFSDDTSRYRNKSKGMYIAKAKKL